MCIIYIQYSYDEIHRSEELTFNPSLPEVFRVTLLPEVGYIIPQSKMLLIWLITLHQDLTKLTFYQFFMFSRSRNPFLTFSQSCHVRVTSKIQGQLPVLLPILALIADTVALVACIFVISSIFMLSRSRNPFFAVSQSYHVRVTSKIQVNFLFYRFSRVLMIGSYGFLLFFHSPRFRDQEIHFSQFHKATMFG